MGWEAVKPILAMLARDALKGIGMWLAAHGFLGAGDVTGFIGAGMFIAGIVWTWWVKVGNLQVAGLLKKLTDTKTQAAAVAVAKVMPSAAVTGASDAAKTTVAAQSAGAAVVGIILLLVAASMVMPTSVFAQTTVRRATLAAPVAAAPKINMTDPIAALKAFTVVDLQAALDDANANNDTLAATCYTALIPVVQANLDNPLPTKLGAFLAFQKARDIANKVQAGIPQSLNIACAPLVLDAKATVLRLGAIAGGAVATGPFLSGGLLSLIP